MRSIPSILVCGALVLSLNVSCGGDADDGGDQKTGTNSFTVGGTTSEAKKVVSHWYIDGTFSDVTVYFGDVQPGVGPAGATGALLLLKSSSRSVDGSGTVEIGAANNSMPVGADPRVYVDYALSYGGTTYHTCDADPGQLVITKYEKGATVLDSLIEGHFTVTLHDSCSATSAGPESLAIEASFSAPASADY